MIHTQSVALFVPVPPPPPPLKKKCNEHVTPFAEITSLAPPKTVQQLQISTIATGFQLHWWYTASLPPRLSPYWVVHWSWFAQVNALCHLLHKKSWEVAASLPGRFLSRCCFTLCITREVEPRIGKQWNATTVAVAKITGQRGWRLEKKCFCFIFLLIRRSQVHGKNAFWGIL